VPHRPPSQSHPPLDGLDDAQRALYRSLTDGPRGSGPFRLVEPDGTLTGPFGLLLHSPDIGAALAGLGEAIRYRSSLSEREREVAILAVAAHHRSSFEWYAHERVAQVAGMGQEVLRALQAGQDPGSLLGDTERLVLRTTQRLLTERHLNASERRELRERLGETAAFELVALVGYYEALALLLSSYGIGVPRGEKDPFSPPALADSSGVDRDKQQRPDSEGGT